jgi:hydroxymethylpyrimidine pyrophosphatase-like HAD family hydrolase
MIRLIATDLDGTLWGPDMLLPTAHASALAEVTARGIHVVAATARRPRVVRAAFEQAQLSLPAVLMDGTIGIDLRTNTHFHRSAFRQEEAIQVLATFRAASLDPCVYIDDPNIDVVVSERPSTCRAHLLAFGPWVEPANLDAIVSEQPVYAFSLLGLPQATLRPVAMAIPSDCGQVLLYPEPTYNAFGLIVNPPGITKWSGVAAYCHQHGIGPQEVLAVGDGDNDVTMLQRAGIAVAVSGGTPGVLALTEHRIPPPSEGGWANLLDLIS